MTITNNIVSLFEAREDSSDWVQWEKLNPKGADMLAKAALVYKNHEDKWLKEFK